MLAQESRLDFSGKTIFTSRDPGETQSEIGRFLWPHCMRRLGVGETGWTTKLSGLFLGDVTMLNLYYGDAVEIDAGHIEDYFLVQTTLSGVGEIRNGNRSCDTSPGVTTVVSPSLQSGMYTGGACQRLIVKVSRRAVELRLNDIIQRELREPLIFDLKMEHSQLQSQIWLQALQYVDRQYRLEAPFLNLDDVKKYHSALLISLLLHGHRHNYTLQLEKNDCKLTPRHVRRAKEYIEANLHNIITLADLARETGVTARTLQNGFQQFLQQSPIEYIRNRRVEYVHNELCTAEDGTTVTEVMIKAGVGNFGRFAHFYRQRYGVLPSQTLQRVQNL